VHCPTTRGYCKVTLVQSFMKTSVTNWGEMATEMTQSRKQVDQGILSESGKARPLSGMGRVQESWVAAAGRREFGLSFWGFGPTELRILLTLGTLDLLSKPRVHFLGGSTGCRRSARPCRNGGDAYLLYRTEHNAAVGRRKVSR
jgi:hypothetical protein